MKFLKNIIAKLPLVLCGVFFAAITVKATSSSQVLYFPLDTYKASNCNYTCYTNHHGVDFAVPEGTAVYAPITGTIVASENSITGPDCEKNASGYYSAGNYIKIQDDTGVYTVTLMHLQTGSVQTYDGTVNAGDLVGYVSNTGNTMTTERSGEDLDGDGVYGDGQSACGDAPTPQRGYHLHVGLKVNGTYADPSSYWITDRSGIPIKAETTDTPTCDVPDATAAFYVDEVGNTYYATNNTTDSAATWSGVLQGEAEVNGSDVTFTVSKPDGSAFTSSGTMYLKVGGYNSYSANRGDPIDITAGDSAIIFAVDDQTTHEWCTYSKDYYIRYEADSGGYTEVGPLTIEQVPALGRVANTDADYDELDDSTEATLGTDAAAADTDSDGLSDGFEVAEELNPLSMDTNGDGTYDGEAYSDAEESSATACSVPTSGDWTVSSDCTLTGSNTAPANVSVADGITLTIDTSSNLDMDLSSYYLKIGTGSRVVIKVGGKIN